VIRIGELAERTGVTPRTIRYYEEIGLLTDVARPRGSHRLYDDGHIERIAELTRLRDLLNLSLEELKQLADAESARAALRREWNETDADKRRIVAEALPHVETQIELVRRRKHELEKLEAELVARRARLLELERELA
jgi:MerR family transcriptional regulator, repressor of the yfmOP operon